jgi:hypothetical protein
MVGSGLAPVQDRAHLSNQSLDRQWLGKKGYAFVEHAAVSDGLFGVARHEQGSHLAALYMQLPGQCLAAETGHHYG